MTCIEILKIIMVLHNKTITCEFTHFHGTPNFSNCIIRPLLLEMRSHDTVTAKVSHTVDNTIFVGTHHTFVGQVPKKTTRATRIPHHHVPIILQSCTMSAIIETMEKLRRHKDFRFAHIVLRLTPRTIMLCLKTITVSPRIKNHAFLNIPTGKLWFQFIIEAPFVTVTPENDTRMIFITCHHFFHQLLTNHGFMCPMPATQLTLHIKSERITGIQKLRVGRIMGKANGIHVHRLDKFYILDTFRLTQRSPRLRTKTVTVHTLEDNFLSIHIDTITHPIFYRTETKLLTFHMQHLSLSIQQREDSLISVRSLCSPQLDLTNLEINICPIATYGNS